MLHDGVGDAAAWTSALDRLSGAKGDGIFMRGQFKPDNRMDHVDHRIPAPLLDLVFARRDRPADLSQLSPGMALKLRQASTDSDFAGPEAVVANALYRQVLEHFGLRHFMATILERTAVQNDYMVMLRRADAGNFVPAEVARFNRLIPHIARAFRARRQLADMKLLGDQAMATLDRFERGIVLTGENGEVRFANRAAIRIFSAGDGLSGTAAGLTATRPDEGALLRQIVAEATATAGGRGTQAVAAMSIARRSERAPYAVVAEPLAPAHGAAFGGAAIPGAIVFVSDADGAQPPATARLRAVYGLTGAEAAVAAAAYSGTTVTAMASALNISANTVKTHLKMVYAKVGVSRQAELVARLAAEIAGADNIG